MKGEPGEKGDPGRAGKPVGLVLLVDLRELSVIAV